MSYGRPLLVFALALAPVSHAFGAAPTLTFIASFNGTNGANPENRLLLDAAGNIYGTTRLGGTAGHGTIFSISADTHVLTSLGSFDDTNGWYPSALMRASDGNLYGTTEVGGTFGGGTIFQYNFTSHSLSAPVAFNSTTGLYGSGALVEGAPGHLLGTTGNGSAGGRGVLFDYSTASHVVTNTAYFDSTIGLQRHDPILDASGNVYGTSSAGGASGKGTIFKYNATTHTISTLASFSGSNGQEPTAGLVRDASGNFYGTTIFGGAHGVGTIFKYSPSTNSLEVLFDFSAADGANPKSTLLVDALGNLYGTTNSGNTGGRIFRYSPADDSYTTLYTFSGTNSENPAEGLIADAAGNLYGTTYRGGAYGYGAVFVFANSGFVPIPEPATLALFGIAASALFRRRKNRAA